MKIENNIIQILLCTYIGISILSIYLYPESIFSKIMYAIDVGILGYCIYILYKYTGNNISIKED